MITDTLLDLNNGHHEVCIVGAGPVGLSLALELSRLGLRVLVLESGGNGAERDTQVLSEANILEPRSHDDMTIAVARRLGGTSNLWGGRCLPYDPIDFMPRSILPDPSWPINLEEIKPYYQRACQYANCGAPVFENPLDGIRVDDNRFSYTSLERWSNHRQFQLAHKRKIVTDDRIDVRLHSTVVDFELNDSQRVEAVIAVRPDGVRHRIPTKCVVVCAGGVETTRLLLSLQRRHPVAFGGTEGPLGRYYMGHLIGEIADVRFSTDKIDEAYDFFVDQHGSYVRRRFVPSEGTQRENELTNVALWPVLPRSADPRHGSGLLSLVAIALSVGPVGRLLVAEAIRKRQIPDDLQYTAHFRNIISDLPKTTMMALIWAWRRYCSHQKHPAFFFRNSDRRYGLFYHAEHLPNPDSRIRLSTKTDRYGLPQVEIDLRFRDEDGQAVVRTHEILKDWLRCTRFGEIEYRQPSERNLEAVLAQASHGTHQIGTVRMATSRDTGVVDKNLRCFDIRNLFIASTAALPTSGQANPTLTTIALSLRLAQTIAADCGRPQSSEPVQRIAASSLRLPA